MSANARTHRILQARAAVTAGAHAAADAVAAAYEADIVAERLAFLIESERWDAERMEAHQVFELRRLLRHAGKTVPFYRRTFAEVGFDPEAVSQLADLEALPLIDKAVIQSEPDAFISEAYSDDELLFMTTGGSTGDPLRVFMDRESRSLSHANTRYYLEKAGFPLGSARGARLHGDTLAKSVTDAGQVAVEENGRLTLSGYHLSAETLGRYLDALERFRPDYLHAYPSAAFLLATLIEQAGASAPKCLKAVFCDSETSYPWQRERLRRVFGAPIFNTYGHTEGATIAITLPGGADLRFLPQVGVTEFLDAETHAPARPGEPAEIVATGFNNWVMPLIRYRTYDMARTAAPSPDERPPYPRCTEIVGRVQDYLVTDSGELVPIAPALFDYNFDWTGVERFRVVQDEAGLMRFEAVRSADSPETDEALKRRIEEGFTHILSGRMRVDAAVVDALPQTQRGKFRYVEQRLDIKDRLA